MFKVNDEDFIVNFEHILPPCSSVSIVNFKHVIAGWSSSSDATVFAWIGFAKK